MCCLVVRILSTSSEGEIGGDGVITENRVVAFSGTTDLVITVMVESTFIRGMNTCDSCPSVQWSVNGTSISTSADYTISDPCNDITTTSPYTFTLTIATLTQDTSGDYTAVFSLLSATERLELFITIPGKMNIYM